MRPHRSGAVLAILALALVGSSFALADGPVEQDADRPQLEAVPAPDPQPALFEQEALQTSSGTWILLTTENCYDLWATWCSSTFPADQCPPNPAGQPCTQGDTCWHVIMNGRYVERFYCQ
jgi:hypothetical protein